MLNVGGSAHLIPHPTSYAFSRDPDGARPWAPNDVTKTFIRLRKGWSWTPSGLTV